MTLAILSLLPWIAFLLAALVLGGLRIFPSINPMVNTKSKVISTVTGISADTDDCDEAAGYYEIPRGAERIKFTFLSTLNTGFSTGSAFFTGAILGSDDPSGPWAPIAGTVTAELVVDVAQQTPSAANSPGVTFPRFIKVRWDETGAMTSFTATCRISYELPAGAGRDASPAYLGG